MPRMSRRLHWLSACLLCLGLIVPSYQPPPAYAAPNAATVTYKNNIIYIGNDIGTPASESITVPDLAAALASQAQPNLLTNLGGNVWLLQASVVISRTGELVASSATISELRLDSPAIDPVLQTALNIKATSGGHLLIDNIKVSAWQNGALDTTIADGRSYLLAFLGGRMDISNSEVHHLGYINGEPSGLSWRKRLNDRDPTTGATGSLINNDIHNNYFGMYSYAAYGVQILRNKVHDNIGYGIDPHTGTQKFEVADNDVYNNHYHGIIFSRDCLYNWIHDNRVYNNDEHGIMMDRGSNNNTIENNIVHDNSDGISIFQSKDNLIRNNTVYSNQRGIRINATFDTNDIFDGVSSGNQVTGNQFTDNKQYGVYLYARADENIIANNQIISTTYTGIYIRSGGNIIQNNTIQNAGLGINIVGGDTNPPRALPWLDAPGTKNTISGNTISGMGGVGVRMMSGSNNTIGPNNLIQSNDSDGIAISKTPTGTASLNNTIFQNTIQQNSRYGILIKDASSAQNKISQNSITGNGALGIKLDPGAQGGILPPVIPANQPGPHLVGTAKPNALVEIYSDPGGQGKTYLATQTADGNGAWSVDLPGGQDVTKVTALQTDVNNNSSAFSGSSGATALVTVTTDINGQTTISVTGAGAFVTLPNLELALGSNNTSPPKPIYCGSGKLLNNLGNGVWQLNANLFIGVNVTLNLGAASGASEVKLCSQAVATGGQARGLQVKRFQSEDASVATEAEVTPNYLSFVNLRTYNGDILIDHAYIHSWDEQANNFDTDPNNGRAYILAKYEATLNISDSELSYLGSPDDESYGIAWRDINTTVPGAPLRTRVTGNVLRNNIHHNYYGVYTFQATNMVFDGNTFHDNIGYGFDPHDFTHDVTVSNNKSYNNGTHGFIISRGCNNFTFENNESYNNGSQGFMLDPGSPNSIYPQAPTHDNWLINNQAHHNGGFGLRMLNAVDNLVVQGNHFYLNNQGLVLDEGSQNNLVDGNTFDQNSYGLVTQARANNNTITNNSVNANKNHGIYLHSNGNIVSGNTVSQNLKEGIALSLPTNATLPVTSLTDNQLLTNTISSNGDNGIDVRGNVLKTLAAGNQIAGNKGHGIYLFNGPVQNTFMQNSIRGNSKYGIQASGPATQNNLWSENSIYGNLSAAISLTNGANASLPAPTQLTVNGNVLLGNAKANSTVEIFADVQKQAQFFLGRAATDAQGDFKFTLPASLPGSSVTAILIDTQNNASPLGVPVTIIATPTATLEPTAPPTETPTPSVTPPVDGTSATNLFLPIVQR